MLSPLNIQLKPNFCNQWPLFRVTYNDTILFEDEIRQSTSLCFDLDLNSHNHLKLEHFGKYFGEDGRWDTVVQDGNIIQDRSIELVNLELGEVDISKYIKRDGCVFHQANGTDTDFHGFFGFNGHIDFRFPENVYDWIIETWLMKSNHRAQDLILESSHNNLFDYRDDLREIEKIEHTLEAHADLFGQSTKV